MLKCYISNNCTSLFLLFKCKMLFKMNHSVCSAASLNPHIWESSQDYTLPVWMRSYSWSEPHQHRFDATIKRGIPSESVVSLDHGKGGMDVLGPQHMMIIKPTNSNFSSSFYNYAPQGNKRERFKIWAEGCGAIWQHKQNYLNTSETSSMHFLVSRKQAACVSWFLPAFSNHM